MDKFFNFGARLTEIFIPKLKILGVDEMKLLEVLRVN
jgi:hypothetical protein